MKPLNPIKNQYRGINAHLHSYWQAEGGWDSFHTNHIADLMRLMEAHLPNGYVADIEQSLQIRRFGEPAGKPESDVTIEDEVSEYRAIGIYEFTAGKRDDTEPVAWVELLSPSNKLGGQNANEYRKNRLKLLHSGIVFVEIDYLHESPPTFDRIPHVHPYRIVVVDSRPVFIEGLAYPYQLDVDAPLPVVDIPLNSDDVLAFDFGEAYNKSLNETRYARRFVDYTRLPLNFDRYSTDDRARILNRMVAVLEAAQQGIDLDKLAEPLPVGELLLNEALARVQGLGIIIEK